MGQPDAIKFSKINVRKLGAKLMSAVHSSRKDEIKSRKLKN